MVRQSTFFYNIVFIKNLKFLYNSHLYFFIGVFIQTAVEFVLYLYKNIFQLKK
jgi:hypothetical protein